MRTINPRRILLLLGTALIVRLSQTVTGGDRERGDVPGWVMITLMSATLVAVIMVLAETSLRTMFESAMSKVNGP
ncbi:hypothetical protein QNO08_12765 [Arthrobacter sp. zg-Y820]|uniref:hypothetical protein n=1 Tax=unclassified Arthrobacter TaxID=235627 RepID=UPI001E45EF02|nr:MULTISPECIES: hypothetical protein [unclassified Arthrobacter]MCC9196020.1 hypothetical protein [Arthrobacter sp. zg-Y820]MDK1278879.1 hypothetical protein [Arthrobacter sp. zg.Y820]MDK1359506.1 hypothetical protein [Arthrobacter sp. zg-Y1219]WIB08706.1 hypothetical protein QNO08_12765 [Arthrobacter sp. zg-Y820]